MFLKIDFMSVNVEKVLFLQSVKTVLSVRLSAV